MPTVKENLETTREQIAQQLADITINPKPSYSIDGQSISWGEHFRNLTAAMKEIEELLQRADNGGAWIVKSQGVLRDR